MRRFTRKELARYNGKDGAPAFIAYEGKVYDVSRSFLWQDGRHQVLHTAGVDLTAGLDQAPMAQICWKDCLSLDCSTKMNDPMGSC